MLPDVVQDHITDAARRLGYKFTEQVFYLAALDAGYSQRAEDKAQELNNIWIRRGYRDLPMWVRDFVLKVLDGSYHLSGEQFPLPQ